MDEYNFKVVIEQDEDGMYIATVPAIKSCYTQAKTIKEVQERIKEVIELCLETEEDDYLNKAEKYLIKILNFHGRIQYGRYTHIKNNKFKTLSKKNNCLRGICKHNSIKYKSKGKKSIYE